jgi:RHS repeat-associated protein
LCATIETSSYDYLNRLLSTNVDVTNLPWYQMTATYDANGNEIREDFTENRPATIMDYGLDNQLLHNSSETKRTMFEYETGGIIFCYNNTEKKYTYQFGEKLLRQKSDIHDSTNPYDVWDAHYDDYFYYSHDGVVAELHDDTGVTKKFTRLGRELLCCVENTSDPYFYIQNLRGDVVMLVGSNGDAVSIRDYDASGEMLCKAPRDRDPFGFTGGLDAGNGLWKLGARFYDSGKNAFIQQDRYLGSPDDPLSLNRYVYCEMDPVNYVDPTGFRPASNNSNQNNNNKGTNWTEIAHKVVVGLGTLGGTVLGTAVGTAVEPVGGEFIGGALGSLAGTVAGEWSWQQLINIVDRFNSEDNNSDGDKSSGSDSNGSDNNNGNSDESSNDSGSDDEGGGE